MFLLDTSIISELRKPRPHGAVVAWYRSYSLREHHLPSIALYELQAGVEITRRQDATKAEAISEWMDRIASQLQVLPLSGTGARLAAKWMHGKSSDLTEDAMIAAIAATNRLAVATRNIRDFELFPVALINPFVV